jgi:hypothetical protein
VEGLPSEAVPDGDGLLGGVDEPDVGGAHAPVAVLELHRKVDQQSTVRCKPYLPHKPNL